ncbi:MAG: PEP-CTERM sorting domain-containing protein [Bryobacteraceae bacterium]|nr:PEP-CTERM sorting domain-containing protein [Bryobacteraceae bacterium]
MRILVILFLPLLLPATVLYQGSLNTSPGAQGWTYGAIGGATETVANGETTLDTSAANGTYAGYSLTSQVLDRIMGFEFSFTLRLLSEAHANNDRAGLSIILLSSDKRGIELAFWDNEVWAQNEGATKPPRFTHGEGAAFDTTQLTDYRIQILGNNYTLSTGAGVLLTGTLRDYSNEPALFGVLDIYNTPNFVFVGDNTTSARGSFALSQVTFQAVPEPTTGFLTVAALALFLRKRA